jgi:carbon monoxide dehydrogenase subunit G
MKIAGRYTFNVPHEQVWAAIYDPRALLNIIPGCQEIEQVSATEYRGQIQLRLPAVIGVFQSYMRLVEAEAPYYSRFEGEVEGMPGSVKGSAWFRLKEAEGQTLMEYEGEGLVTGPLARLNSHFIEGLAKSLIDQGLAKLNKQLEDQKEVSIWL